MGRIKPVSYVKPMSGGRSSPHLILFDDGHKYVVKFKNNPQGNWVVTYEYIVNTLAKRLQLPIPQYKVVKIRSQFIKENKELEKIGFKPGNQFASQYIEDSVTFLNLPSNLTRDQLVNADQIAGLIVFDHWIGNSDRNTKNLLFLPADAEGNQYEFKMIDHANCFNISTSNPERKFLPLKVRKKEIYRWCNTLLDDTKQLNSYVDRILEIKNEEIYKLIYSMSSDWLVDEDAKERLYRHIKYAKKALPKTIDDYIKWYLKRKK
ncbi:HipA family kinase [Paenibacillus aceris]|uniref:HipA-like kinase domain-containing protein n=1 Tax=Paenibacillus aceris TaxID=869555 RepID=A0ABS4IA73_9BACL|nr:HipA family kinase [Paenibacillus aceris]MBP1966969.1 hypothetical protein [Paenibacillus aceris]NHW39333.1 hypothetical protein [Paenibacillus aceris]